MECTGHEWLAGKGSRFKMIESLLFKTLNAIADHVITLVKQEAPRLDVYLKNGILILENYGDEAIHDALVASIANRELSDNISRLDTAKDPNAMEKAFQYISRNGGNAHVYPPSGKDVVDEGYRIKIARIPRGVSRFHPPRLETRKDEFAFFEVVFRDYRGRYWMKRSKEKPKRLSRLSALRLTTSNSPTFFSQPME